MFDPYRLIPTESAEWDRPEGKKAITIQAIAAKGEMISHVATFHYQTERRHRDAYISQELAPGLRMIRDFDNDKLR